MAGARPDLPPLRRIALQAQVVEAVEAAGEDTLPEFSTLCTVMAGCEQLGPQRAWEQADEVIHQLYTGRYYDECVRYCKMVLEGDWADREARAWAWLRIICCHRRCSRDGTVHPFSERLMREYPDTVAARNHTKAAAGWMEAYLRDDDAIALLDRMAEQHGGHPEFVLECAEEAAWICRRSQRLDALARWAGRLRTLAARPEGLDDKLRARCAQQAQRLEAYLARARERKPGPKPPPKR